jgi:hypothetical protein
VSIINQFVRELTEFQQQSRDCSQGIPCAGSFNTLIMELLEFLETKKDILKIIIMESLIDKTGLPINLCAGKMLEGEMELNRLCCGGQLSSKLEELKVEEFFMNYLPLMGYIVFKESFCQYNNMEKNDVRDKFITSFQRYKEKAYFPWLMNE